MKIDKGKFLQYLPSERGDFAGFWALREDSLESEFGAPFARKISQLLSPSEITEVSRFQEKRHIFNFHVYY